ncbi:S-layer protein domain-containing protein [Methanosarcina sp. KYL-1]|uniref:S-layer protein domain-containing protein n=1 Tax=Methanosarcina sp. KYL-1 TaxID=2602068 RepID=UPI002101AB97|nr:S-layer protein domain-containing protein [Methanosarcina sp. KYL-1]
MQKNGVFPTILALTVLLSLLPSGLAASVEIPGAILDTGSEDLFWNAENWGALYADIDNNESWTERFYYENDADSNNGPLGIGNEATIDDGELTYSTAPYTKQYKVMSKRGVVVDEDGSYTLLPWLGEKYVAVNGDATTITKLLLEQGSDDVQTLKAGETWDLEAGYSLECKQVDVDGNKVWLALLKDGEELDSEILNTDTEEDSEERAFVATSDFADQEDAVYFVTYADKVFQSATDSVVRLKYTWIIDKDEIQTIDTDFTLGEFECTVAESDEIVLENSNSISLNIDDITYITDELYICISDVDIAGDGNFYIYPAKEATSPGTYEVRGTIVEAADGISWDASSWGSFYFDIDNYESWTERFYYENAADSNSGPIGVDNEYTIDDGELTYSTAPYAKQYKAMSKRGVVVDEDGSYTLLPWIGEKYVAINGDATTITKLLLEQGSDDIQTLKAGETWDLGAGYTLECKQVDVDGNKVWLALQKDGEELETAILNADTEEDSEERAFVATADFADQEDAVYFVTYVDKVFQSATDSVVKLKYTWLIDKEEVLTIDTDFTLGEFECTVAESDEIVLENSNAISLEVDDVTYLTDDLYFTSSDVDIAGAGKYYIYPAKAVSIEAEEEDGEELSADDIEETESTEVAEESTEIGPLPRGTDESETADENTVTEKGEAENAEKSPGFGILTGLLGICLLAASSKKK